MNQYRTKHGLDPGLDVGRVQIHVRKRKLIEQTVTQRGDLLMDLLAGPADRRLGHARLAAGCFDQLIYHLLVEVPAM